MTAVLYSFVTDDLDSCLSYFTLPMKEQPQYPPSFTYFSPQYSLSLSKSAFVIPTFGSLPTTTQVFMKVCTTAHLRFGISFSSLTLLVLALKPSGQELLICLSHMSYCTTSMTETELLAGFLFVCFVFLYKYFT